MYFNTCINKALDQCGSANFNGVFQRSGTVLFGLVRFGAARFGAVRFSALRVSTAKSFAGSQNKHAEPQ